MARPQQASPPRLDRDRRALLPVVRAVAPADCCAALLDGGPGFLDFVLAQDLGPLWHHRLQAAGLLQRLPPATAQALRTARQVAAAGYLAHRWALAQVDELFSAQGIAYVVMKGVHVRECIYPDPAVRPASDIDILVAPQDRRRAAQLLLDNGYTAQVLPNNVSFEASFRKGPVDIDLHWSMLREGRTRVDLTAGLLARRQQTHGVWGLSDSDAVFMMLTHPAFGKYVCSPNMGLGRVADFMQWVQQKPVDWPAVVALLEAAGLKTAGWIMLSWFRMLGPPDVNRVIDEGRALLRPGPLRAAYLQLWLTHDLPTRLWPRERWIQLGFTLYFHDRPADMLRVLHGVWHARRHRLRDARLLMGDDYEWGAGRDA
jgi:hypothetical protein